MNLVDRILGTAWRLVLLLLVLAMILPMATRMLGMGFGAVGGILAHACGSLMSPAFSGTLLILFIVGLGVRLARMIEGPTARHRRHADRERLRRTVRRPASEIPAHGEHQPETPDEDPSLPLGGR